MNAQPRWYAWTKTGGARLFSALVVLAVVVAGLVGPNVARRTLAADFAAGESVVVDTDALNLRTGAGLSYAVTDVLAWGTSLTTVAGPIAADGFHWYQVRTDDGAYGWVAGEFLAYVRFATRYEVGDVAVVDTPALNCRVGPGLDYAVDHVMAGGSEVVVLGGPVGADGYHWYRLQMANGNVAWAIGEGLASVGADDGGSQEPVFAKGSEVHVAVDALNLRAGAGLAKTVGAVLPGGTALLVSNGPMVADGYAWYEVETRDGRLGWVAGAYLTAATSSGFAVGSAVRVTGGALNLRAEPDLSATVRRVMAHNEALLIQGGRSRPTATPGTASGTTAVRAGRQASTCGSIQTASRPRTGGSAIGNHVGHTLGASGMTAGAREVSARWTPNRSIAG